MPAPEFSQATWRKPSRSNGGGSACVEVADVPTATGVRDSKLGETSPILPFSKRAWRNFLGAVKNGEHDLP